MDDFYNFLLIKRGFCDVTVDGYRKVLRKFVREVDIKPTVAQIEDWIAELRERKCSNSHIRNSIVILENYGKFLGLDIKLGRMRRNRPIVRDILTEGEVARILAACKNERDR